MNRLTRSSRLCLSVSLNISLHLHSVWGSINITRVQSTNLTAIQYLPGLADGLNEWVVRPFGQSDQEASTIWHDPRLFFRFHGE